LPGKSLIAWVCAAQTAIGRTAVAGLIAKLVL
jgi:hypothetical protein